ncbi:trypsin-like peptidase domain-containing protein [Streptomyces sp. NPDC094143]|uniref:trypsin-like peptidase domain-containing protein n=1 Tax=Streptomyces sp. NPDC094143 TaxID=3155310 RepID=UPI00332484D3
MTSRNRSRETDDSAPDSPGHPGPGECADQAPPDEALVRIHDLAGRPRGTGFLADHHGTLVTSHEAVDGLPRLVLYGAGDRRRVVTADAITPLPALGLALVRTEGLGVPPLPVTARHGAGTGTYVRIAAGGWREARVLGATGVTYAATDRFHHIDGALELAVGTAGRDALRLGGGAAGGPVVDAVTGAVVAVLGTALRSDHRDVGFAVPLHPGVPGVAGPLADLLAENAATVPAYGDDLNLAGVLELTGVSVCLDGPPQSPGLPEPVERAAVAAEFSAFASGPESVLGLVGAPGSGRTTELAALAARRARGGHPTLWLRGCDLREDDTSVADAARRALTRAAPVVGAARVASPAASGVAAARAASPAAAVAQAESPAASGAAAAWGSSSTAPAAARGSFPSVPAVARGSSATVPAVGAARVASSAASAAAAAQAEAPAASAVVAAWGLSWAASAAAAATRGSSPSVPAVARGSSATVPAVGAARAASPASAAARVESPVAVASAASPAGPGDLSPERLAHRAASLGRPLLLLLDGPEEMPPALARRFADWADGTLRWLRETGVRLVVACRAEYWEEVLDPLHRPACVPLGDLTEDEAREAGERLGIPRSALAGTDARHPLTLRLLAEIRAALDDAPERPAATLDRNDVFAAYVDLMALRIATRLAAGNGLRGTAVRRLAAKVAGQVHEAARRSLGPGLGDLDPEAFEAVFPWGTAPERLGGGTGWASAVLAEGLLVPSGPGYRFAHEELADWLHGLHLDLDEALHALVQRRRRDKPSHPVPHHRIGPVVQALLCLERQQGTGPLASRLAGLVHALDADPESWWAARLLAGTLAAVPDATPYTDVLRLLADRVVAWRRQERPVPDVLGPDFWTGLRLAEGARFGLLGRLVHADGPPCEAGPRFLDAVARLLSADPVTVQPQLVRWFDDEQPLPATPHATVALAAQALLHTHRHRALDELVDVLVDRAHRRADELLAVLAEEEPSALCRATDRWARDERPDRRAAAMAHGLRVAPHVTTGGDRALLRYAALTLLARPADRALHGGALALLVQDPHTRVRYLPRALEHFAAGDPHLPPDALAGALLTHPEPVLGAFAARLERPDADEALRALADATPPGLARPVAALVRQAAQRRPELAGPVAAYVDQRLDRGPAARAVLLPLVTGLLEGGPVRLRCALAGVLTPPGIPASRPLRRELREALLAREHDTDVLDALLQAAARNGGDDLRDLVHRIGLLLGRTPEGAGRFDRALVDLGRHVPGFAVRVAGWLADAPDEWAALVGPSSHRTIENLAGVRVPA